MKKGTDDILPLDEVTSDLKVGIRTVYRLAAARRFPLSKPVGGDDFIKGVL